MFQTWRSILLCLCTSTILFAQQHVESNLSTRSVEGLPNNGKAYHFLIVGDWGRNGQADQQKVADWMGVAANQVNAKFVISTGDNFYCCGVASTQDYQWLSSYENVFRSHSLQIPWYIALGNHDYQGNVDAQIAYSKVSQRWKMPARYFSKSVHNILLAFIDTTPFIQEYYQTGQYPDITLQDTTRQLRWLDSLLMTSNEKWKIVVGHHPIYSVGEHGSEPDMQQMFLNRFKKHVQVYFAGHDHSLQSLKPPDQSTLHLISGAGSETTLVKPDKSMTRFAQSTAGFMVAALTEQDLKIYFVTIEGKVVHTETLNN